MNSENSILMIGCGGLGKCLLELNLICKYIPKTYKGRNMRNITIIEPLDLGNYSFYEKYNIHHVKVALTKKNINNILNKHIPHKIIVLDVSIGVNALSIIKLCNKYDVMYVNTSLENWDITNPHNLEKDESKLYKRTLYYQYQKLFRIKNIKPTMVFDHGMNPGLISHLSKMAIQDSYQYLFDQKVSINNKKSLAKVAKTMNLLAIHVSELDTQRLKKNFKFRKNTFYNTWSGHGMIAEAIDPIQIGCNSKVNSPIEQYVIEKKGYVPKEGLKNIKYYPIRGVDKSTNTVIISDKNQEIITKGFLIPHGESNTLSNYLSTKNYTPSVYYVYHPSFPTMKSLEILRKRKYKHQPNVYKVLDQNDISKNGYDSIGARLIFDENIDIGWWTGTILSVKDVQKLGLKYAGPTETQVAISFLSCIKWMLNNPQHGLKAPEELPSDKIIKWCLPYLGKFVSKPISKKPEVF